MSILHGWKGKKETLTTQHQAHSQAFLPVTYAFSASFPDNSHCPFHPGETTTPQILFPFPLSVSYLLATDTLTCPK